MEKLYLEWEISEDSVEGIVRYCHNCGDKVIFTDSLKRRRNANGKNIYEYAIYKCPKEHTWNRMIDTYSAQYYTESGDVDVQDGGCKKHIEPVNVGQCLGRGVTEIEISLESVKGDWRLDKLLALHIGDLSRSQIEKYIKGGRVLVNDEAAQTKTFVKTGWRIRIRLG